MGAVAARAVLSVWDVAAALAPRRARILEVDYVPTLTSTMNDSAVRFSKSTNITLMNSRVSGGPAINGVPIDTAPGGLDVTGNVIGLPTATGVNVSFTSGLKLINNDIGEFGFGINLGRVSGALISGNHVHDTRSSPVRGGVVSYATIENTLIRSSRGSSALW
jgi:hypothetical protein